MFNLFPKFVRGHMDFHHPETGDATLVTVDLPLPKGASPDEIAQDLAEAHGYYAGNVDFEIIHAAPWRPYEPNPDADYSDWEA